MSNHELAPTFASSRGRFTCDAAGLVVSHDRLSPKASRRVSSPSQSCQLVVKLSIDLTSRWHQLVLASNIIFIVEALKRVKSASLGRLSHHFAIILVIFLPKLVHALGQRDELFLGTYVFLLELDAGQPPHANFACCVCTASEVSAGMSAG